MITIVGGAVVAGGVTVIKDIAPASFVAGVTATEIKKTIGEVADD